MKLVSTTTLDTTRDGKQKKKGDKAYPIHSSIGGNPSGFFTSGECCSDLSSSISYRRRTGDSMTGEGVERIAGSGGDGFR